MDEEPELYVVDFSNAPGAEECRAQLEHARATSRRRYRDYLAAVFDLRGCTDPGELAEAALDTLTEWRYVDSSQHCMCSCHPRLPDSDHHDYGFGCPCTKMPEERHKWLDKWRTAMAAFWQSEEGQRITAAERAAEAELNDWLATQRGVFIRSHGGYAPEQWRGEVDGHTFYFRERHDEWRIELDLRPSGHLGRVIAGIGSDGEPRYEDRELDEGDVTARGTIDVDGYGTTPAQRAAFIADTIRVHLTRQSCTLHTRDLSSLEALLDSTVSWCPSCGTRLPT